MIDSIAKIPYNEKRQWKVVISPKIVRRAKRLPKKVDIIAI